VFEADPVFSVLSRALDNAALQQAVHTSNIANASSDKYSRLQVVFENELQAAQLASFGNGDLANALPTRARVMSTGEAVKLDQEMALMAKDAVHYQALLGAYDRSMGLLRLATREGKV